MSRNDFAFELEAMLIEIEYAVLEYKLSLISIDRGIDDNIKIQNYAKIKSANLALSVAAEILFKLHPLAN